MGHNPLWSCIPIPIENFLSKRKCIKNSNATSKKYLAPLWRVMQGLQEYSCPFSFNFRGYIGSIFIRRLVRSDFQVFSRFHLVSLEFIANFLFIFATSLFTLCLFVGLLQLGFKGSVWWFYLFLPLFIGGLELWWWSWLEPAVVVVTSPSLSSPLVDSGRLTLATLLLIFALIAAVNFFKFFGEFGASVWSWLLSRVIVLVLLLLPSKVLASVRALGRKFVKSEDLSSIVVELL